MNLDIATHQARSYTVETPVYEGPLDLLLQLIERAELDITKVALASVTDQYLEHLRSLHETAAQEVSAFLVIAARLLQIKSEVLLPRPPEREEDEEDPGEALARQLRIYKRFKEIAEFLSQREEKGFRTYLRLAPPPKIEASLDTTDLDLEDLVAAARAAFTLNDNRPELKTVVAAPKITIREKISMIAERLRRGGRATFQSLLNRNPSQLDVVVTFLAMLELVKRHLVRARQTQLFGDIELEKEGTWDENETFELEFGE